jgi:hypothetical protein
VDCVLRDGCLYGEVLLYRFIVTASSRHPIYPQTAQREYQKQHPKYSEHKSFSHSVHVTAENRRSEITKCPTADDKLPETK